MTFQRHWGEALFDPDRPVPDGLMLRNGIDLEKRMAVYRNNVMVSLIDALSCTFTVTQQLVGEAFFRAMAREYIRKHPAQTPVLSHYGHDFSGFIQDFMPAASLPYLADIARLEYLRLQTLHAADVHCATAEEVRFWLNDTEHSDQVILSVAPCVFSYQSEFAAVSIWAAHDSHSDINLGEICLTHGESALIFRSDLNVMVLQVEPAIACFVALLTGQYRLSDAVQAVDETIGVAWDLSGAIALLLHHGLLANIEQGEQVPLDHPLRRWRSL